MNKRIQPKAQKFARHAEVRRTRNNSLRTRFGGAIRSVKQCVAVGCKDASAKLFCQAVKILDSITAKGVYHNNKAARHKRRLNMVIQSLAT